LWVSSLLADSTPACARTALLLGNAVSVARVQSHAKGDSIHSTHRALYLFLGLTQQTDQLSIGSLLIKLVPILVTSCLALLSRSSCTVTVLSLDMLTSSRPICLRLLSKIFMVSFYVETTLHIRVAGHISVRTSRGSSEQLTADETFAKSVTTDDEDLADLVGAITTGTTHLYPPEVTIP
jgi:hypothetical protein